MSLDTVKIHKETDLPDIIDKSWYPYLQPLFADLKMKMIVDTINESSFYPDADKVFRVFHMPIDRIKVVILGQDPYNRGEAIGLAFAVDDKTPTPASLKIIYNEMLREHKESGLQLSALWGSDLWHWVEQGVFLLNTALTVEPNNAGSHAGIWSWFTKEVIHIISGEAKIKPIWLLWGGKAKAFRVYIHNGFTVGDIKLIAEQWEADKNYNWILQADHPAAETYPGGKGKFTGCNHFNLCNTLLELKGQEQMKW